MQHVKPPCGVDSPQQKVAELQVPFVGSGSLDPGHVFVVLVHVHRAQRRHIGREDCLTHPVRE